MYIDAKGKESLELKGMPVRARRGRQCKVSGRRGGRGGTTQKSAEWSVRFQWDEKGSEDTLPLQDHKRLFLPSFLPLLSLCLPPVK